MFPWVCSRHAAAAFRDALFRCANSAHSSAALITRTHTYNLSLSHTHTHTHTHTLNNWWKVYWTLKKPSLIKLYALNTDALFLHEQCQIYFIYCTSICVNRISFISRSFCSSRDFPAMTNWSSLTHLNFHLRLFWFKYHIITAKNWLYNDLTKENWKYFFNADINILATDRHEQYNKLRAHISIVNNCKY